MHIFLYRSRETCCTFFHIYSCHHLRCPWASMHPMAQTLAFNKPVPPVPGHLGSSHFYYKTAVSMLSSLSADEILHWDEDQELGEGFWPERCYGFSAKRSCLQGDHRPTLACSEGPLPQAQSTARSLWFEEHDSRLSESHQTGHLTDSKSLNENFYL